jgi:hypothetical protein
MRRDYRWVSFLNPAFYEPSAVKSLGANSFSLHFFTALESCTISKLRGRPGVSHENHLTCKLILMPRVSTRLLSEISAARLHLLSVLDLSPHLNPAYTPTG